MIHDRRDGRVPFGIELDGFALAVPPCRCREGDPVMVSPGRVRLGRNPLAIIVRDEGCAPSSGKMLSGPDEMMERAREMQGFLNAGHGGWLNALRREEQGPGKGGAGLLRRIEREKARLLGGLASGRAEEVRLALRGLIGLGIGLTPSMDDWLVGFVYALRRAPSSGREAELLSGAISRACLEGRTNLISSAYLQSAAGGGYFERLELCLDEGGRHSMESLSRIGSSSGMDMLEGMCAALKYAINASLGKNAILDDWEQSI